MWGEVLIGPLVTALKPEAGRSIPGQDEVALTSDGGPNGCCSAKHSFERGRALIGRLGRETSRRSVKLRTRYRC